MDLSYDSIDALKRQLYFLASLKDQYSGVYLTLPGDLQLNRLLKEDQIPHRLVEHASARQAIHAHAASRVGSQAAVGSDAFAGQGARQADHCDS